MKKIFISIVGLSLMALTACALLGSNGDNKADIPGKIVFSAKDSVGTSQIFTMQASGRDLKQLTHYGPKYGGYQPAWSPDGQQILFSSFKSGSSIGPALWVMDADGSNRHLLYKPEDSSRALEGNNARWSPDGTKVVFDLCLNCQIRTNNDIYLFDTQTKQVTQLTEDLASDTNPTWSPDGQRIAFASDRDYVDADTMRYRTDLYLANADESKLYRLTKKGFLGSYIWIDRNIIIYAIYDPNTNVKTVIKMNMNTKGSKPLLDNLKVHQFWLLANANQEKILTINKKYEELPIIIDLYDLNGKFLLQTKLENSILKSASSFDWFISTKN